MKELFEFVLDWPKQQEKAGEVDWGVFFLISLTVVFVVMVLMPCSSIAFRNNFSENSVLISSSV